MCTDCRAALLLARAREKYQAEQANRGPLFLTCANCGCQAPRTSSNQKVCEDCRGKWGASRPRDPVPVIGAPFVCSFCGVETVRTGAHQKVCEGCRDDRARALRAERDAAANAARAAKKLAERPAATACAACGAATAAEFVRGRWYVRTFCESCAATRKHAQSVSGMERQRRKNGIAQVKGTTIQCARCGCDFVRSGIVAKFCDACGPIVALERANATSRRKCRERGAPKLGGETICAHCSATFKRMASRNVYCDPCRELQKAGKLPSLRASISAWRKRRHASDPSWSINSRMRSGIRHSLNGGKAGRPWESLVGYDCAALMRHLERQFLPGMTWANRGDWEMDHIQPLSSFSFTTAEDREFKAAWCLSNLRPLWKADNYEKRAKRLFLL
jgi:hypothetical protein